MEVRFQLALHLAVVHRGRPFPNLPLCQGGQTPGPKRTLLKAIINNPASKKRDELERNLMKVEEYVRKCEMVAGTHLFARRLQGHGHHRKGLRGTLGAEYPGDDLQTCEGRYYLLCQQGSHTAYVETRGGLKLAAVSQRGLRLR